MLDKHTGSPSTHATPRTTIAFSTSVGSVTVSHPVHLTDRDRRHVADQLYRLADLLVAGLGCDVEEPALVGADAPAPDGADRAHPAPAGSGPIGGRP